MSVVRWPLRLLVPMLLVCGCPAQPDGPITDGAPPAGDARLVDGALFDAGPCTATSPRTVPLKLSVFPDDGEQPFTAVINAAKQRIRVYAYLLGVGGIQDALRQRASAGVDVRLIVDRDQDANNKYVSELKSAGAKVVLSDPKYTHMHAKVIIVDDTDALISTGNYSYSYSIKINRDYLARTSDPQDLADLIGLFDADWNNTPTSLPCTRLLVAPNNARARLLELIDSAKSSMLIESMQFADTEVRTAVAKRKHAGVNVRVILADPSWVGTNSDAALFLAKNGVPVRWMKDPDVHAKAIVVDGKAAYLGSINISFTSLNKNREVGVVATDAAVVQRISSTFEKDWLAGKSF